MFDCWILINKQSFFKNQTISKILSNKQLKTTWNITPVKIEEFLYADDIVLAAETQKDPDTIKWKGEEGDNYQEM